MKTINCKKCNADLCFALEDTESVDVSKFNITCACKNEFDIQLWGTPKFARNTEYWFDFKNEKNMTFYKNKQNNGK